MPLAAAVARQYFYSSYYHSKTGEADPAGLRQHEASRVEDKHFALSTGPLRIQTWIHEMGMGQARADFQALKRP